MNERKFGALCVALPPLLALACGVASTPATAETIPAGGLAAPTAASAQRTSAAPAGETGFDVTSVDLCSVLTRAELAGLAGGTPYEADEPAGQLCIYTIDPGDGTAALYSFGILTPDLVKASLDYVRDYEQAEWIDGLGDAAALQPSDVGEGYDLNVLVEDAYGLSFTGPDPEVLRTAARLVIERVGE